METPAKYIVAGVAGIAAFALAFWVQTSKSDPEPTSALKPTSTANAESNADKAPSPTSAGNQKTAEKPSEKTAVAEPNKAAANQASRRPLVVKVISAPLGKNTEVADWGKSGDDLFQHVYLSEDAGRVITLSNRESIHWDSVTSKRLYSFASPMRAMQVYIAPDARTFVELKNDPNATAVVRSTVDGATVGVYKLTTPGLGNCSYRIGFTPQGDHFVFCQRSPEYQRSYSTFHVVSTRTGQGRALKGKFPEEDPEYTVEHLYLQPIPNSSHLLMYFHNTLGGTLPARVCLFDSRAGKLTGFSALTVKPAHMHNVPAFGFQPTLDGKLLMIRDAWGPIQICQPLTGKIVAEFQKPQHVFRRADAVLTPDGSRLLILDQPSPGKTHQFYLHDLSGDELADFDSTELDLPENIEIKKLAISRDGRTVAVLCPHKVYLLDFQAMFRRAPLPVPRPWSEQFN